MDESRFKPDPRSPPSSGAVIYDTPEEAMDELHRRINVLGQARYVYEGLAIRMASDVAMGIQDLALHDSKFSQHKAYGGTIDVFETPEGFHVSVDEASEIAVKRAELGTTTTPLQALWGPWGRALESDLATSGADLAEIVAESAGTGHALEDADVESLEPLVKPTTQPGLNSLRQIVADREALMAKEES
jgi:hypothetical protein